MLRGIDVSDYQADIDWPAVVSSGVSFAIIKATENTGNVQDTFAAYRDQSHAAGIGPLGIYHFARPENGNPEAQADHFADIVLPLRADEFVVLDVETGATAGWPDFIERWIARLGLSVPVVVYMSESPAKGMPPRLGRFPLWVAGYQSTTPTAWEDWQVGPWTPAIWQWNSSGSVPGVNGQVDMNIAPDDLRTRLGIGDGGRTTGWGEIDRYLLQEGVAINVPAEEWQTTGGGHVSTSWHYRAMARDYSEGTGCDEAAVVAALRPFAVPGGPIIELFHAATDTWLDEGVYVNVGGHTDHCHVAIRPGASLPVRTPLILTEDDMKLIAVDNDRGIFLVGSSFQASGKAHGRVLARHVPTGEEIDAIVGSGLAEYDKRPAMPEALFDKLFSVIP